MASFYGLIEFLGHIVMQSNIWQIMSNFLMHISILSQYFRVLSVEEPSWTEEGEDPPDHSYYNNIPGKMPPPGGFIDARLTSQTAESSQVSSANLI